MAVLNARGGPLQALAAACLALLRSMGSTGFSAVVCAFVCTSLWPASAQAQSAPSGTTRAEPSGWVSLSASSFREVPQDWLQMSLGTTREGTDASALQTQLKTALEAALARARAVASPGALEVRTGAFNIYPRFGNNGKVNGWRGSVELVLEGRDFALISTTAGKIDTLNVMQTAFALSRQARQQLEAEVQAQAIERFKARASEVARSFGFQGYGLREVAVSSADADAEPPRARMMAMEARAAVADAPVPVEAGRSTVSVTVSGSIQLR